MKKKLICSAMVGVMAMSLMGCGGSDSGSGSKEFDASNDISVISREDGSGTRGAFVELFGIEQKDESGEKVDYTIDDAAITNSTAVMMTSVAGNQYAIGYISLGSLDDSVKALKVNGAVASVDNIKSGEYEIARPFNIAVADELSETAQDFIDYILSAEGQAIIEDNGYISVDGANSYSGSMPEGKIVIAGSSSVSPVMEKLQEAYLEVNTNAEIEIQTNDSTTGVNATIDGTCDIGMASRELKDSETSEGVTGITIAMDGIAVIVNNNSTLDDITTDQVMQIYTGEITKWSDIITE